MNSPNVLLIEDNPGDADLIRLRLVEGKSDMNISTVNRLSDALSSLEKKSPSVVLLDLNLPDSHGAETFRRVLGKAPGVPVVVLSGQDDEELATKAVHQGVQDYLVKGNFDSKQLARAMRYAIERQGLLTSLDMSRKQQLQFKDQFLSHVSHELRTPLTSIYQFVTILLDGLAGSLSDEQRDHLETILRSANQLRTMIADLLEATRAESGKTRVEKRCVAVGQIIQQSVAMLQASANEKGVSLTVDIDNGIPLVLADPDRALQILTNLVHNAIKFTPSGGSATVKASLVEPDPEFVYISVSDTGVGVTPEARPLIFERLYQEPD
ncbi:MAG TPA: hybrid sensor histidine kinase/response regulator, partial [Terriglobales bacterium]|nr:hybrid sensor histidine kinase/response regulator [Terriglobales bacterium]